MRRLLLAAEAACLLVLATVARRLLPLRWLDGILGVRTDPATAQPPGSATGIGTVDEVRWALGAARRRLPWSVACVPDALAAACMLRRRHLPYRVTIGISADRRFAAHAWLEASGVVVTGGRTAPQFTPLSAYDHVVAR